MNEEFYNRIKNSISHDRLVSYGHYDNADSCTTLARYLLNIALSESLYSVIHIAEITFRNKINESLAKHYNRDDWYEVIDLQEEGISVIENAKANISFKGKELIPGRVIAELSLGFWISLLDKKYSHRKFQPSILKRAMNFCPNNRKDRPFQKSRWDKIRILRNRISHHERIVHWKDLKTQHDELLETIGWLSKEAHSLALKIDRFDTVYEEGERAWVSLIKTEWPSQ